MVRPYLILLPAILIGCATAQESCINRARQDLRILDGLIAETKTNIGRGYAVESQTVWQENQGICIPSLTEEVGNLGGGMCREPELVTIERPKAIDLDAETAKLKSMQSRRGAMDKAVQTAVVDCRQRFPEKDQK